MALSTHSVFYFGFVINSANNLLNFDEGGGELTATFNIDDYSTSEMVTEITRALNAAGGHTYSCSFNRVTRKFTISADGTFSLLISTGSQTTNSPFTLLGFTGADTASATSQVSNIEAGDVYFPQFILQDFVDKDNQQNFIDSTVHRSGAGDIQVVQFGREKFFEMNIRFITDKQTCDPIRFNPTGVADAQRFMESITTKAKFEFMKDVDDRTTFDVVILESTPESKDGTNFKLKERFNDNLPDWFDTGILKLRFVDQI